MDNLVRQLLEYKNTLSVELNRRSGNQKINFFKKSIFNKNQIESKIEKANLESNQKNIVFIIISYAQTTVLINHFSSREYPISTAKIVEYVFSFFLFVLSTFKFIQFNRGIPREQR